MRTLQMIVKRMGLLLALIWPVLLTAAAAAECGRDGAADAALVAAAAESGDWARLQQLLQAGDSVQAAQADGMTALHWAALHGSKDVVQQLLQRGAAVGAGTAAGGSALFWAGRWGG
ncbi:MAG: ankyrin repeat domain-containing protein, partial [Planctomyces sp.]